MEVIEKYIPLILAIALTVGGYFIERSILSPVLPSMAGLSWLFYYGISGFVFLLWVVAMFVIAVTYKDMTEQRLIFTSHQVIKLSE
jgi:hypothetical protein